MSSAMLLAMLLLAGPAEWPESGASTWSVAGGAGFSHVMGHSLPDRQFGLLRVSYTTALAGRVGFEIEAIPLLLLHDGPDGWTWGPSFSLLGRFVLASSAGARFGLDLGGGMVFFSDPVPKESLKSNFTLQAGLFLEQGLAPGRSIVFGYRLHHISNADRAAYNPGINASHPYIALRWWSTARRR